MVAGRYSLYCEQGATMFVPFQWTDNDDDPIDLTGYSIRMQVRRTHEDDEIIVDLGANGFITIEDASGGVMRILIPSDSTRDLPLGKFVYDVELEEEYTGFVTRLLEGQFIITPEVTR
jgi:hypothetical protein